MRGDQNFVRLGSDLIVRMQHQRRVQQSRGLSFFAAGSHIVQEGAWISAVVLSLLMNAYHTPESYDDDVPASHITDHHYYEMTEVRRVPCGLVQPQWHHESPTVAG